MPGSFTDYAETKLLDHFLGGMTTPAFTPYVGYFLTDAGETAPGSEPAGGGYQRTPAPPSYWLTATNQLTQTVQDIVCPRATGYHGTVVGTGIFDSAVGGNCWAYFPAIDTELIETRDSLVILAGGLVHQFLPGGFSNYLKNLILNYVYKGVPLPVFPTVWGAYFTSAPTDAVPGTEPGVGGYARIAVANNSANFAAVSGGIKENAVAVQFPISTAPQGTASHYGWFTAESGGQFLAYGALDPAQIIGINSQLILLPGDIKLTLD